MQTAAGEGEREKKMKYTLWFKAGQLTREASSMREAIQTAKRVLYADRVYRGSRYLSDEPDGDDRRTVEALDVWTSRKNASAEMSTPADCVITWR
jgi:hypothetical protein